jgi:hypothetical protein
VGQFGKMDVLRDMRRKVLRVPVNMMKMNAA